jgi:uncharacterized protein (DUF2267 family)
MPEREAAMDYGYAELVEEVRRRTGIADAGRADRALASVASVLCGALSRADVDALAENLPAPLPERLRSGAGEAALTGARELYDRVSARAATTPGLALEETQVILQVLAEISGYEALVRVRKHLPPDVADLLWPREPPAEPPPRERVAETSRVVHETLASGRPGSHRPLSEAEHGNAQLHSVTRESNPHGDRKLSSVRR